jgi:hypothetical protein
MSKNFTFIEPVPFHIFRDIWFAKTKQMKYQVIKRKNSFRITNKEKTLHCKSSSFADKVCFLLNQNESKIEQAKIESIIKENLRTGLKIDWGDIVKWNNNQTELTNDIKALGLGAKINHKTFNKPEDTNC